MSHCVKQIAGGRYRCGEPANARGIYCDRHDPQVLEIARIKARQEKRTRDDLKDIIIFNFDGYYDSLLVQIEKEIDLGNNVVITIKPPKEFE